MLSGRARRHLLCSLHRRRRRHTPKGEETALDFGGPLTSERELHDSRATPGKTGVSRFDVKKRELTARYEHDHSYRQTFPRSSVLNELEARGGWAHQDSEVAREIVMEVDRKRAGKDLSTRIRLWGGRKRALASALKFDAIPFLPIGIAARTMVIRAELERRARAEELRLAELELQRRLKEEEEMAELERFQARQREDAARQAAEEVARASLGVRPTPEGRGMWTPASRDEGRRAALAAEVNVARTAASLSVDLSHRSLTMPERLAHVQVCLCCKSTAHGVLGSKDPPFKRTETCPHLTGSAVTCRLGSQCLTGHGPSPNAAMVAAPPAGNPGFNAPGSSRGRGGEVNRGQAPLRRGRGRGRGRR